ncbi:MAG: hypothetical protein KGL35_12050 [Bradyrhizobium sp.]|nr:hypothetical protein [Bradyrhizobium sp.]
MIAPENIGGATVRRRFNSGGASLLPGAVLSGETVRGMPAGNLRALIDAGYIECWPAAQNAPAGGERFAVHVGAGRYDVIEGRRINVEPLSREEATALTEG